MLAEYLTGWNGALRDLIYVFISVSETPAHLNLTEEILLLMFSNFSL